MFNIHSFRRGQVFSFTLTELILLILFILLLLLWFVTDKKNKIIDKQAFQVGHIVGGNRLKKNKEIYFRKDISWEDKFSLIERVTYYILCFPIMLLNRYKL